MPQDKEYNQRGIRLLRVGNLQLFFLLLVGLSLLISIFIIAFNLVGYLQTQNSLLENDLARSIRPIAQLQREVFRLLILIKDHEQNSSTLQVTLQVQQVNRRFTTMQLHYIRYKGEAVLAQSAEIEEKWQGLQTLLETWVSDPTDEALQAKLEQELSTLELMSNELQAKHEIWHAALSAALAEESSQSLQSLGNVSLLFLIFIVFIALNIYRFLRERRRFLEVLHESEERYRRIVETAEEGICLLSATGKITFINRKMADMLDETSHDIYGKALHSLIALDHAKAETKATVQRYFERLAQGISQQHDFKVRRQDGTTLWILISSTPILDKEGNYTGALAMLTDISDRKIAEEALVEAKNAAEAASQAKSEFLSSMSHELRTPLNGILGYAQILKREQVLTAKQSKGLDIIYESGNHLLTLINDILDLSKIEALKMTLNVQELHLESFLNGLVGMIRIKAQQKNLLFVYESDEALPIAVKADEKRLRQVLINLLGNAVKFTKEGNVTLRVKVLEQKEQEIRLRFEVSDTGIGMSAQELEQIFLPFEQAGDAKQRAEGTGLGLAITRQLVNLMGEEIFVSSELGQGSRFYFDLSLPVVVTSQPALLGTEDIIGYEGKQRRLLVVDDEEQNHLILSNMLAPLGFELIYAKNGQEAVSRANDSAPDLILIDLVMPVMGGLEAVQKIRQESASSDKAIIAISAKAFEEDRSQSLAAGCNAFLPKPVNQHELLLLIEKQLNLTWVHQKMAAEMAVTAQELLIPPPHEQLALLYQLAMLGNMRELQREAAHLEQLGEEYLPFAQKLDQLATKFEDEKILSLIEASMP